MKTKSNCLDPNHQLGPQIKKTLLVSINIVYKLNCFCPFIRRVAKVLELLLWLEVKLITCTMFPNKKYKGSAQIRAKYGFQDNKKYLLHKCGSQ